VQIYNRADDGAALHCNTVLLSTASAIEFVRSAYFNIDVLHFVSTADDVWGSAAAPVGWCQVMLLNIVTDVAGVPDCLAFV
jgi:hypothetical protein